MEWGRLLFDPKTKDAVFAAAYAKQCGLASQEEGQAMLDAMHAAAIMPLRFASFIYSKCMKCSSPLCVLSFFEVSKHLLCTDTFDFSLHSEGFIQAATNPVRAFDIH